MHEAMHGRPSPRVVIYICIHHFILHRQQCFLIQQHAAGLWLVRRCGGGGR
eukprot:COSAG01_NODE_59117_length_302_cov_0.724138_1_plen_50_part_10